MSRPALFCLVTVASVGAIHFLVTAIKLAAYFSAFPAIVKTCSGRFTTCCHTGTLNR
jgi:hypothetical protein